MTTQLRSSIAPFLLLSCLLNSPANAGSGHRHDDEHRAHDAHVHGVGELTVVEDAGMVVLELQAPGMSLAGFEHAPKNEGDMAKIDSALALLRDVGKIVSIDDGACTPVSIDAKSSYPSTEKTAHDHDHHDNSTHNAFAASYQFKCSQPDAITGLQLPLLKAFPALETLSVQWIIQGKQGAGKVDAAKAALKF